jgi:hypothetical protein
VAAADPAEGEAPLMVVDPEVSEAKLERELTDWEDNREIYSSRGWMLLGREGLKVDIGFAVPMPIGQFGDVPSIPLAVRLGFDNYDIWPPSLQVIDPITRRWLQVPRVAALDFTAGPDPTTPLNLFIVAHPQTGHAFLCKQGVREYHSHPEHSGDDWLLYRHQGYGTLGAICDLLWRTAARTVAGLDFLATRTPVGDTAAIQHAIEIRQADIDAQAAAMQPPEGAAVIGPGGQMQLPPEIQAQIAAQIQAMEAGRPG